VCPDLVLSQRHSMIIQNDDICVIIALFVYLDEIVSSIDN